jgi:hypothetical protein
MATVAAVNFGAPSVSWLWHNVIGAGTVVAVGLVLSGRANAHFLPSARRFAKSR